MKKKNILIAAAGIAAILCVGCLALALLTDTSPAPEATTAAEPLAPSPEPVEGPTATPAPTVAQATATPAATPTPAMLTVRDIEVKRKELTDLQWEPYAQEVVGEPIRFSGKVIEVYDDGRIQISDGKGFLTVCILYEVPLDVAASLSKDQVVEGHGTVREVNTIIGLGVWVNVVEMR